MRVNVYQEELTDKVELITKKAVGVTYTGLRFYLELPLSLNGKHLRGPFRQRPGNDDSSAVTFFGDKDTLRKLMKKALASLAEPKKKTRKRKRG